MRLVIGLFIRGAYLPATHQPRGCQIADAADCGHARDGQVTPVLTITEQAVEAIRALLQTDADGGVRISIVASGSNGHGPGLVLEPAEAPELDDAVIDAGGLALYIDGDALEILEDKVLDADQDGDEVRFSVRDD
jgi:Fe-S cluster assembly iron-binding protein IscA